MHIKALLGGMLNEAELWILPLEILNSGSTCICIHCI